MKQLLQIKPGSGKMLLLLLPPVYALWLFVLGDKLYPDNEKAKPVYKILAGSTCGLFTLDLLLIPFMLTGDMDVIQPILRPITIIGIILLLLTVALLTKLTVDLDRNLTPEKYFGVAANIDHIRRFFALVYWPVFIWSLQETFNKYGK